MRCRHCPNHCRRHWRKGYADKVVVLMSDHSVIRIPVDMGTGRILHMGMDLFDPAQPFWRGKVPRVVWPE